MALTVALLVFAGVFIVSLGAVALLQALLSRGGDSSASARTAIPESAVLKSDSLSTIGAWNSFLSQLDVVAHLQHSLDDADVGWSVGRLTASMLLLAVLSLAVLLNVSAVPPWTRLLLSAGIALLPYLLVRRRRSIRLGRFESLFPDALDSLAAALRAGHPIAAGVLLLAEDQPEPVASEFRRVSDRRRLGASWDEAFGQLAQRVPLVDVRVFVSLVCLQNRTGGNLGEVLTRCAETMREAAALRGEVDAIAAHGKLTGLVLTILPLLLTAILFCVNPAYIMTLLFHPWGKHLIAAALTCLVLAHFVIRKIATVNP